MAVVLFEDLVPDQKIKFSTKNSTDSTTWRGVFAGNVNTAVARNYSDLQIYHTESRRTDPDLPISFEGLTFFLIQLDMGNGSTQTRALAAEWLVPGTLELIVDKKQQKYLVYISPSEDPDVAANILREAGYSVQVIAS